jgi:hypothetical protein
MGDCQVPRKKCDRREQVSQVSSVTLQREEHLKKEFLK